MTRKPKLDATTLKVLKQVLALPPKHHDEMKVGRPTQKKKRGPKGRASSAKRQTA
jgi:hypothetical protein